MAAAKHATIIKTEMVGNTSQKIVAEYCEDNFESFISGKFLIVDTGLFLEDGKAVKRAYSLYDVNPERNQFSCVVKRLQNTPGADYMHSLKKGDELTFSGPWGKFYESETSQSVWLIATDTGVTACMGYRHSIINENLKKFFWFRESENYFAEEMQLDDSIETHDIPKVGEATRREVCWKILSAHLQKEAPQKICMTGDGEVLIYLKERFLDFGFDEASLSIEIFFNNPAKKSL